MTDYLTYTLGYGNMSYFELGDAVQSLSNLCDRMKIPAITKTHPGSSKVTVDLLADDHIEILENAIDALGFTIQGRQRGTKTPRSTLQIP